MTRTVLLDSGPLGLLTAPPRRSNAQACGHWLARMIIAGSRIVIPEIIDYELRRELLRARKVASVMRLEALEKASEYLPITTASMHHAAILWATARQQGQPTAGDDTLDVDVILAAQALTLGAPNLVVATTNVGHLTRFVAADAWQNIAP